MLAGFLDDKNIKSSITCLRKMLDFYNEIDTGNLIFKNPGKIYKPKVSLNQTEDKIIVEMKIPWLRKKENINLSLINNILYVRGVLYKPQLNKYKKSNYFKPIPFKCFIPLPVKVSNLGTRVIYKGSILKIDLLKDKIVLEKQIPIKF